MVSLLLFRLGNLCSFTANSRLATEVGGLGAKVTGHCVPGLIGLLVSVHNSYLRKVYITECGE